MQIKETLNNLKLFGVSYFMYSQYLKSKHWQELRKKIYSERKRCEICGKELKKYNIHHLTYERIGNEKEEDLMLLCPKCHKALHNFTCFDCINSRKVHYKNQYVLVCVKNYQKCSKICKKFTKKC